MSNETPTVHQEFLDNRQWTSNWTINRNEGIAIHRSNVVCKHEMLPEAHGDTNVIRITVYAKPFNFVPEHQESITTLWMQALILLDESDLDKRSVEIIREDSDYKRFH